MNGVTPLDVARHRRHWACVHLLEVSEKKKAEAVGGHKMAMVAQALSSRTRVTGACSSTLVVVHLVELGYRAPRCVVSLVA